MYSVYWISHKTHTDIFSQGYVGVSNNVNKRWKAHKSKPQNEYFSNAVNKYGWDDLVKKVVLVGEENYCLEIETKLRPDDKIGWNLTRGGGKPPSALGKKFGPMPDIVKAKVSASKKGFKHKPEVEAKITQNLLTHGVVTRFKKGQTAWNKGIPAQHHVIEAAKKASTGRVHSEEERAKISASKIGHVVTEETRQKIRLKNLGKKPPMTGKHFDKVKCPHCDKIGGLTAMPRWHFNNCRLKEKT